MIKLSQIFAIGLASLIGLTACAPVRDYTPDPPPMPQPVLENPISTERILLGEINLNSGIFLEIFQEGVGYKTDVQVDYWNPPADSGEPQPETTAPPINSDGTPVEEPVETLPIIVDNTRVVVISYTLTNNSNSSVNVGSFDYRNGYYVTGNLDTEYAFYDETSNSLHANSLDLSTYPNGWEGYGNSYILQPGESATWILDWGMPTPLPNTETLTFSQNFLFNDIWYTENLLELKLFLGENNNE